MIKINKKYLKKIIQEEAARISENQPWSEESVASEIDRAKELDSDDLLDFDKDDPQEWQDWDVIVSGLSGFIMDKLQDTIEDPRDLHYVERQIEVPLLDMVKGLEGDVIEHLLKALGDSPEGGDLMEEKKMKIAKSKLARMIQEEISKVLSEEDDKWMQKAFSKKKGSLHHLLGVDPDKDIPIEKMRDALCKGGKIEQKARAAVNANQEKYASIKDACVEKKKEDK